MDHDQVRERLDDFVDGVLPDGEGGEVRMHLERCAECRAELESLVSLLARARALPREIAPGRDLWPQIAARIAQRRVIEVDFARAPRRAPRRWLRLAAASAALVVASSGLTLLLVGRGERPVALAPVPAAAPPLSALAAFEPTEAEYLGTVEALQAVLDQRREQLLPSTVATLEENLRIIDQAIAEARAALQADPSDAELPHMLSGVYRKKVELLQSAIQIPIQS